MERMICQCCGEALHKRGDVYECRYCGAVYRDDQAERAAGLLRGLLDDFKLEQLSNARRRLYETTHERYPSSQAVTQAAGAVLSISPDDFMARVYLHSHDSDPHELISLLARGTVSEWEAKETLAWLIRSLDMRTLAAVKDFADRHLEGAEKTNALSEIEDEALKLDSGVYDLSLKRDVFLCYSTDDMPRVIEIMETFEENALSCFAAFRNLRHGKGAQENYQEAIFRAMGNCRVFVFLSSNHSRDPHRTAIVEELDHLISDLKDKPRVEFLLEDYPGRIPFLAKRRLEEAFPHLEHCRDVEDLLVRVSGLLDAEENAEKNRVKKIAEEAKRELQAEFEAREAARKEEQAKRQRELEERLAKEREEQAKRQKELEERLAKEREEQAKRQRELEERLAKEKEEREETAKKLQEERLRLEKEKLEVEKRRIEAERGSSALPPAGGTMDAESMLAMMEKAEELKRKRAEEAEDKRKAEPAVDAIKAIGKVELTPECRERIAAARACYSGLTEGQRAHVHNADVLLAAEREYGEAEAKERAATVERAIKAIGGVECSSKCKSRVDEAQRLYDALPENGKALVSNHATLVSARAEYEKLEAEAKEQAATAKRAIEAIGGVEYSPKCKSHIDEAQRLYDALPEKVKALVSNHATLVSARAEYEKLEAEPVVDAIKAIGKVELTPECRERIAAARAAYSGLTERQRAHVHNADALLAAEREYGEAEAEERKRLEKEEVKAAKRIAAIFDMKILPDGNTSVAKCRNEKITEAAIPESYRGRAVTSIGERAFSDCRSLKSIAIPESVTSIGDSAFRGCIYLTSITIPEGVTSISGYAFAGCTSLKSIAIPEGVTSIGESAFCCCSHLTSITIPKGVTSIGGEAFSGCSRLTSITIPKGVTSIGERAFYECLSLTSIAIPEGVTSIGGEAFSDCDSLTSIAIPEGVTSIGGEVFSRCKSLKSIAIPKSVISIGERAFCNCSSLTSIVIPEGVTSIGEGAFAGCTCLKSISIPEGVTSIGEDAFCECSSLASIAIPESVTSIGGEAFYDCESLTSVTIGRGVTSIGWGAFWKCSSLTSITLPKGVTSIDGRAFLGCSSLTSIAIPESVTSIGGEAFSGCTSLTSITIPKSVTSIGDSAFFGCRALTSITIPESVTSIDNWAFIGCSSLTSIAIPESVTSIGGEVFSGCSCAIHFAHKKPLFGYPEGFSKDCLKGFKGKVFWGGK